ncbi:hypothetical protein AB6Q20_003211 [Salmonella enterica]
MFSNQKGREGRQQKKGYLPNKTFKNQIIKCQVGKVDNKLPNAKNARSQKRIVTYGEQTGGEVKKDDNTQA